MLNLLGIEFQHLVLQLVLLAEETGPEHFQLVHLRLQIRPLDDLWVARCQCLDLIVGEHHIIDLLHHPGGGFGGEHLGDEPLFVLHHLIQVAVEGALGDIAVNSHLRVLVPLADDPPTALLQVTRPPGAIKIVEGDELVLYIGPCSHFGGRTHQHPHLPGADFPKELLLLGLVGGAVDKGDLFLGNPTGHEFFFEVIVHAECSITFGYR